MRNEVRLGVELAYIPIECNEYGGIDERLSGEDGYENWF